MTDGDEDLNSRGSRLEEAMFKSGSKGEDAKEVEEMQETEEAEEASPTKETGDGEEEEDSTKLTDETHDLHMYLPEPRYQDLMALYKRLDGEYYAEQGEDLEKNRQYFDAVIETALEHDDEIREKLGLD